MRRRRFMKLIATGAAAVLAPPLRTIAAPATKPGTPPHTPPPPKPATPAVRAEIAAQKKSLDDTLKAIRDYQLPPGSPPAYVFRAQQRDVRRAR